MTAVLPETFGDGNHAIALESANVFVSPSAAAVLTLPPAAMSLAQPDKVIKNLGPGTATILGDGGQNIEGGASLVLAANESAVLIPLADGSGWAIVTEASPTPPTSSGSITRSYGDGTLVFGLFNTASPLTTQGAESAMTRSGGNMELVRDFDLYYNQCQVNLRVVNNAGAQIMEVTQQFASLADMIAWVNANVPASGGLFDAYVYIEVHDVIDAAVPVPSKVYGKNRLWAGLTKKAPGGWYHKPATGSCFYAESSPASSEFATVLNNIWTQLFPANPMPAPGTWTANEFGCFWIGRNRFRKYDMPSFTSLEVTGGAQRFVRVGGSTVARVATMRTDPSAALQAVYHALLAGGTADPDGAFDLFEGFRSLARKILVGSSVILAYPIIDGGGRRAVYIKPVGVDQFYFNSFDAARYRLEAVGIQRHDYRTRIRTLTVSQAPLNRSSGPIDASAFDSAFGATAMQIGVGPGQNGYRTGSVRFQHRDLTTGRVSTLCTPSIKTVWHKRGRPFALMVRSDASS